MTIRPFNNADLPAIFDIYRQCKLDELRFEQQTFTLLPLEEDEVRLRQLLASDIFVYESNGILAYGAVYQSEIRALFVTPQARGQGIGQQLLDFLLDKTTGDTSLYVAKTNAPAKQLYKKYGFKVTDEFQTHYNGLPVQANKMVLTPKGKLREI